MKLTTLALLLPAAEAAFTISRDLQTCPSPSAATPCTMELAPVKCGSQACEYDNQCNANAAGYSPGVCWPSTCTAPSPDVPCTFISNPVLCGDSKCEYASYCVAEAAGFPPTVCEAVNCPQAPDGVACSMEYDPFVCLVDGTGLCTYDNGCIATQAGQDPNSGECVRTPEYIANLDCPAVSTDTVCPLLYAPIRCGDCTYANDCEAGSAGFDVMDPFACQSANCALPAGDTICTADFTPVTCEPEGCTYSNQCNADAAGYSAAVCVSANCPVSDPNVQCTREYDPYICTTGDGLECTYDNLCVAQAAGQSEANCVAENDPVNPDVCEVPDPNVVCTLEIDEKYCGENDCFYSNQCQATAAGFTEVECRNINCPASTATLDNCADFGVSTNLCGPYNCPYLSTCTANRAGWLPAECKSVDCPAVPATTLCTTEYDPIVCASAGAADGVPCPYSNTCLAQAAGYDTAETAGQCVRPLLTPPTRAVPFELMTDTDGTPTTEPVPAPVDTPSETPADTPAEPLKSGAVSLAAKGSMVTVALAYMIM